MCGLPRRARLFFFLQRGRKVLVWPPQRLSLVVSVFNRLGVEFLLIELDLAVTFCEVGLATRDFVRAERNADNAPAALQAVLHAKEYLSLTDRERQAVLTKTSKAVFLLVQLERRYLRLPDKMT